jgi:hypothetical protein
MPERQLHPLPPFPGEDALSRPSRPCPSPRRAKQKWAEAQARQPVNELFYLPYDPEVVTADMLGRNVVNTVSNPVSDHV